VRVIANSEDGHFKSHIYFGKSHLNRRESRRAALDKIKATPLNNGVAFIVISGFYFRNLIDSS
jgi:hypothetical protein